MSSLLLHVLNIVQQLLHAIRNGFFRGQYEDSKSVPIPPIRPRTSALPSQKGILHTGNMFFGSYPEADTEPFSTSICKLNPHRPVPDLRREQAHASSASALAIPPAELWAPNAKSTQGSQEACTGCIEVRNRLLHGDHAECFKGPLGSSIYICWCMSTLALQVWPVVTRASSALHRQLIGAASFLCMALSTLLSAFKDRYIDHSRVPLCSPSAERQITCAEL